MSEIDVELAELSGVPVIWGLETEAVRVDERHDSHLHLGVRQIHAADAAVVLGAHAEVVLAAELLGVAGWLQGCHHELVFVGDLLHLALLFLLISDLVLDFAEVELHVFLEVAIVSIRTVNILADDSLGLRVAMSIDLLFDDLLDREGDVVDTDGAL